VGALNLILYVRWVMEVGSVSHTRLVFPAIAAIVARRPGLASLLPRRLGGWFNAMVIVFFLALNLYSLGWLLYPTFTPTQLTDESITPSGPQLFS
jgi:hypothetical protein